MANFKKRALSLFVALVMIISMMPMNAFATSADSYKENDITLVTAESELPKLDGCLAWQPDGTGIACGQTEHTHSEACYVDSPCQAEGCVKGKEDCKFCENGTKDKNCGNCGGRGWTMINVSYGLLGWPSYTDCHYDGCENCGGDGKVRGYVKNGETYVCDHSENSDCVAAGCKRNTATCSWCAGTGYCHTGADNSTPCWKKCATCKGTGKEDCQGNNGKYNPNATDHCNNGVTSTNCSSCEGTGCSKTAHTHNDSCYKLKYKVVVKHTLSDVDAKAATCTENGYSAHQKCDNCDYKQDYEVDTARGYHVFEQVANKDCLLSAATCDAPAVYYKSCACGAKGTETFAYGQKLDTHNWGDWNPVEGTDTHKRVCNDFASHYETGDHDWDEVTEEYVAPTCTAAGMKSFVCSVCETTKEVTDGTATGHDWDVTYTWTETETGYTCTALFECKNDAEHNTTKNCTVGEPAVTEATCTVDGIKVYTATVEHDNDTYTDEKTVVIPAPGHSITTHEAKKPTCTEVGWDAYETCTCGYTTYNELPIDPDNHKWAPVQGEGRFTWSEDFSTCVRNDYCVYDNSHTRTRDAVVTSVTTDATCEADGSIVYTATIPFGDRILTDTKTVTLEKLGHEWRETSFAWNEDHSECEVTFTCVRNCEETLECTVTSETTPATCEVDGKTVYTATVEFEGETYTDTEEEPIGAIGHKWSDTATYNWDGYTACTATVVCLNDDNHTKELTCTVNKGEITTVATCAVDGKKTYTATAEFEDVVYTDEKVENLGKNMENHDAKNCKCRLDRDVLLFVGYGKNGSEENWFRAGTGTITNAYPSKNYKKGYMPVPEGCELKDCKPESITIPYGGKDYNTTGKDFYILDDGKLVGGENDGYHMDFKATFYHTVDFVIGEETISDHVIHGGNADVPVVTAPHGYKFDGWTGSYENVTASTTVTANFSKISGLSYTVKYVDEAGNEIATAKTEGGKTFGEAVKESAIEIEGYTADEAEKSITIDVENKNNEIVFEYTVNKYTVTWIVDGETTTTEETFGQDIALPETDPVKEGHSFAGWEGIPEDGKMPANEELVITATWNVNQYTMTFVLGNGAQDITITENYGTEITAPSNPLRGGYTFAGWGKEVPATMPAEDMTFNAQWNIVVVPYIPTVTIPDEQVPQGSGEDLDEINEEAVPLADGSLLNTDEYIAYINGYDENGVLSVKPTKEITRAEFFTIIFRLLNDDFRLENWGTESRFTDVDEDDWFFNEITTCDNIGLLDHYEDETFKPNEKITREEVAYVLAMFVEDAYEGEEALFTDIDDSFAFDAINDIYTLGIISGDGNGEFRPQDNIKRGEIAKMVNLVLGRDGEVLTGDLKNWSDNVEGKWYFDFIRVASNSFDAETFEAIETEKDYWKNKEDEWAAAFAALIPEDETEDDEEIEG